MTVCSKHFIGNLKSETCPNPIVNLDHKPDVRKRPAPKTWEFVPPQMKKSIPEDKPIVEWDHVNYSYKCDCQPCCDCVGCVIKGQELMKVKEEHA